LTLTSKDQLTFGSLYNYITGVEYFYGVSPKSPIADGGRSGGAAYAQIEHELMKDLKAIGGFQANKVAGTNLSVVPRVGMVWNPVEHVNFKALYSEAFRAPSINETLIHYVPPSTTPGPSLIGNPDLKPEKVATVDVGVMYQGNRFLAGLNYFYSKQTDNIILDAKTWTWTYTNFGEIKFHGVEAEGKYYFDKRFLLMGSLLYQANKDDDGNKNVTPIANFGYKAGFSYDSDRGFTASLFDVYQGHINGYEASLNPKPRAYHLLNAHLRLDLCKLFNLGAKNGIALIAHADNLTNKAIWLPDWKDNPGGTIFTNKGRTVYFGIEAGLGTD